jgi:Holliday junction DNA helicase RuvA
LIASVSGTVTVRRPDHVVVEAAGVGYQLAISGETLRAIPAIGNDVGLHAHLISRDDGISLYGFAAEEERDLFLMLISVSGIGPKVALAALSGGAVRELLKAIAVSDAKRFQAVPGIGKRTAERIIVELREKVAGELAEGGDAAPGDGARGARQEAREGLLGLGYAPEEVERLLDAADGETAEDLIGAALRAGAAA